MVTPVNDVRPVITNNRSHLLRGAFYRNSPPNASKEYGLPNRPVRNGLLSQRIQHRRKQEPLALVSPRASFRARVESMRKCSMSDDVRPTIESLAGPKSDGSLRQLG